MSAQFDTSGRIYNAGVNLAHASKAAPKWLEWTDLSPFVQGYMEAMFAGHGHSIEFKDDDGDWVFSEGNPYNNSKPFSFSDLAPETLARIMEDCERARTGRWKSVSGDDAFSLGKAFWTTRQLNRAEGFPPLTPYLGNDGKVYLREA